MTKEGDEDFENYAKCWICDVYVEKSDHCQITGKYRGSANNDCKINVRLNHEIPIVLNNLKNYDLRLIMKELDKFDFKINVIPNGLEKYISFNISNKLIFY